MKVLYILIVLFIDIIIGGPIIDKLPIGYVPNTPENIALLHSDDFLQNPEELSGQFEGDIILNVNQAENIQSPNMARTGLLNTAARWPDNTVYYHIEDIFSDAHKDYIRMSLEIIETSTCLRFIERTIETDYVNVTGHESGCFSSVGRRGGAQQLNLELNTPGYSCMRAGTIMHEFYHAMGFYHMQSATERDDFVTIKFEHIESGKEHNFNTYNANTITNFGVPYDATSIMHYGAYGFTMDGYATIVPNDIKLIATIGQRAQLVQSDINRLNAMYECIIN